MKNKTQKGYALLITVVVISIILLIATGLSNTTTKQLVLFSSVKDSQIAFYQADTASECALYADYKGAIFEKVTDPDTGITTNVLKTAFPCGIDSNGNSIPMVISPGSNGSYSINPPDETSNEPCFRINVTKSGDPVTTDIKANGYNICDLNNIRTVERTIEVSYGGDVAATPPDGTGGTTPPADTVTGADGLTYGTVIAEDGRTWLDRNLGATRVATAYSDASSYGWYYQWGRETDGHQKPTSATTTTQSSTDSPGHGNFIINPSSWLDNWSTSGNNNLWQGLNGINNPCPTGFRLPTNQEWVTLISSAGITNYITAYNSSLKLTVAGYRYATNGLNSGRGAYGAYWSSNLIDYRNVKGQTFYSDNVNSLTPSGDGRENGLPVRCIKD